MSSPLDVYWRAPPMARTFATLVFAVSVGIHTGLLPGYYFVFHKDFLTRIPPQLWRLATTFMITGPNLGVLFDTYFIYVYTSQLEMGHPKFPRREDLLWYLIFVCSVITILNVILFPWATVLLPALVVAMAYTVTQDQRGVKTNFFFLTVPAQLVPYCMVLINLLFPGGVSVMMIQLTGLFAAHLHDFLTRLYPQFAGGPNLLPTPGFLSGLVHTPRILQRNYGTAIRPPQNASTSGSGSGASAGPVLPDSWRSRGTGHRLGGD